MGWDGRAVGPYHLQMPHMSPPSRYHCPQTPHPLHALESRTWGPWRDTVTEWWNRASAADLHHVSCLRIPQSLWDHIPRTRRVDPRERVAWHQYHALHGVCQLRGQLTMPPRDPHVPPTLSTAVPAWYTKLRPRAVRPNPTDSVLHNSSRVYGAPGENIAAGWPRLSRDVPP